MKLQDKIVRPGGVIFAVVLLAFALFLLSQLFVETKFSARGKLFAQPRFWPAIGVFGMVFFGGLHLVTTWFATRHTSVPGWANEVLTWTRALEYLAWFMIYVAVVPIAGYLASTICFTLLLALRLGYRKPAELWLAVALGFAVVVVFKAGLSVKIPGGAVYEFLPGALRTFMIVNF